jgi:hypothetical protein
MSASEPNPIGPADALLAAQAAEPSSAGANSIEPSGALLATPAAEHAFAAGVTAVAIVIALVAVVALRRADGGPAERLRPYSLGVLASAVAWSIAHALSDPVSSDTLQLFLTLAVVLGISVGLSRRPSGLVIAVGTIMVVPNFAAVIVASGPSEQWTTNEALYWGALLAALTAIPFLVAFTVTATLANIGRWHRRNSAPRSAGPAL